MWNLNKKWTYTAIIISGGISAYFLENPIQNTLYSRENLQIHLTYQKMKAKLSPPKAEKLLKALWLMQGIQAITLFYFRKRHLPSLIPLIGIVIALYESSKRLWLELEYQSDKMFSVQGKRLPAAKLSYHTLIFQDPLQASNEECFCMDYEEIPRDAYYCPEKHCYHIGCLVDSLATNLFKVGEELDGRNVKYDPKLKRIIFQINEETLPHCPNCRKQTPVSVVSFNLGTIIHIQQTDPS